MKLWCFGIGLVLGLLFGSPCQARPGDGWVDTTPNVRHWFEHLVQPDAPKGHTVEWLLQNGWSCCGEADAYEADEYERSPDGNYVAIITDTRDDTMRNGVTRPHIALGTRINVPNSKVKWDEGNPTPHGWIFFGGGNLYCFVAPGGT